MKEKQNKVPRRSMGELAPKHPRKGHLTTRTRLKGKEVGLKKKTCRGDSWLGRRASSFGNKRGDQHGQTRGRKKGGVTTGGKKKTRGWFSKRLRDMKERRTKPKERENKGQLWKQRSAVATVGGGDSIRKNRGDKGGEVNC